jgi:Zn-dependent protease with chaperone function
MSVSPTRLATGEATAASPSSADRHAGQILRAVEIDVPKFTPPVSYGLATSALALCLVLLPLAYLALVAFLGWLLVWHVFQTFASFEYGPYFIFHVPMALLGGLLLVFLIKPVFFRRRMRDEGLLTLERSDEPLLFAFVERLCKATRAPAPARIEVDCDPNASARFGGGFLSLVPGKRELVLRIGLPLAAGFSIRQFAGVMSHELGHFNQKRGMTASYLIRRLTAFFAEVVFQRDRLDERLVRLRLSSNAFAQLFYYVAVAFIEPARGVLWLMLLIGELLTCGVLRRMEHDADNVEAHVAGVREFINVSKLLLFLQIARRRAEHDLSDAFEQRRLADDLPRLILANAKQLAEHRDDVLKLLECGKTRWFDTHPCHNDRVRSVESTRAPGLVECDLPARHLFARFDDLCQRATWSTYKAALGRLPASEAKLVPTDQLVEERAGQRESVRSLHRFLQGHVVAPRPPFPAPEAATPADDVQATMHQLVEARREMLAAAGDLGPVAQQYSAASDRLPFARAELALTLLFPGNPQADPIRKRAKAAVKEYEPQLAQAAQRLAAFDKPARTRLTLALRLAQREEFAGALRQVMPPSGHSLATFLRVTDRLEFSLPTVLRLLELGSSLEVFFSAYDDEHPHPLLVEKILETVADVILMLDRFKHDLKEVSYPFEHGTHGASVGAALVERTPNEKDPVDAHACATGAVDRYFALTFRCLAKLIDLAERVETAAGMEPLADPVKDARQEEAEQRVEETAAARESRSYWLGYGGRAVAGVVLVAGLVSLSLSPPSLPTMPWESGSPGEHRPRPAAFYASVPVTHYSTYAPAPPSVFTASHQTFGNPGAITPARVPYGVPQQPGFPASPHQPGFPGRSAERYTGYQPPQPYPQRGGVQPDSPQHGAPQPGAPQPGRPQPGRSGRTEPAPSPGAAPRPYTPPSRPGGGGGSSGGGSPRGGAPGPGGGGGGAGGPGRR